MMGGLTPIRESELNIKGHFHLTNQFDDGFKGCLKLGLIWD